MITYLTIQNEWIRLDAQKAAVGLDCRTVKGDVVYIELPVIGLDVQKGELCATVESIKTVSEVHAPVSGVVSAINDAVFDAPDMISQEDTWLFMVDFEGEADTSGWMIRK